MPASAAVPAADEGIYFASTAKANARIWRKTWLGRTSQLAASASQLAATFDSSTYAVPGVGSITPYGFFGIQSSGAIQYYSQDGAQSIQLPGTASAIAPVLGGYFALSYPATGAGESVYYFDYASGATFQEPGKYIALSAFAGFTSSGVLYALDSQDRIWSTKLTQAPTSDQVIEFPIGPLAANSSQFGVAKGPDDAVWFSEGDISPGSIGRINPSGSISRFALPNASANDPLQGGIVSGPDSALWFTQLSSIGRVTTAGDFTDYPIPAQDLKGAGYVVSGSDGALWYTGVGATPLIGRVSTSGAFTQYVFGRSSFLQGSGTIGGIASGSDGSLWFTVSDSLSVPDQIGRITTSGQASFFALAGAIGDSVVPSGIVSGPDGALWFVNEETVSIGRITTAGAISTFPLDRSSAPQPTAISLGPDGALWFTTGSASLGRITTAGVVTYIQIPTAISPTSIVAGSDGSIYFAEPKANKIGRITLINRSESSR